MASRKCGLCKIKFKSMADKKVTPDKVLQLHDHFHTTPLSLHTNSVLLSTNFDTTKWHKM